MSDSKSAPGFFPGTLIATADGTVLVESLRAGHSIMTISHGARQPRPIRSIDCRHVAAPPAGSKDAYLVRIHRDAFAPGVPSRDLLLTGDHGVLVEDSLIAAGALINGRSIERHPRTSACMQYCVAFDAETSILAEGLPAQSDVANAHGADFHSSDAGTDAASGISPTDEAAAAIWQALDRRAEIIGFAAAPRTGHSDIPDIALRLDTGDLLRPHWIDGGRHIFHLPHAARAVQLISRAIHPYDAAGPDGDDRGMLGIAVCRIALWNGLSEMVVEPAQFEGAGWHELDGSHRWTNGQAALSMPAAINTDTFLEIQLALESGAAAVRTRHNPGTRFAA